MIKLPISYFCATVFSFALFYGFIIGEVGFISWCSSVFFFFGIVGSIDKIDLLFTIGFLLAFDLVAINGAKKRTNGARFPQ